MVSSEGLPSAYLRHTAAPGNLLLVTKQLSGGHRPLGPIWVIAYLGNPLNETVEEG